MAELGYQVNPNEPEQTFEPVPADSYVAAITESTLVDNSKGTGQILKLTYELIDEGPFKGRKIFENLNINHTSEQAAQIGRRSLNSIGIAVGMTGMVQDSSQLHNTPMKIEVIVKDEGQYGLKNYIKKHLPLNDSGQPAVTAPTNPVAGTPAPAAPNGDTTAKRPWEK